MTFTMRTSDFPPVLLNGVPLPQTNQVKYLGLKLDRRLTVDEIFRIWNGVKPNILYIKNGRKVQA
jgi:hypothetical protein